jgi:replicative DNA helicase
MALDSAGHGRVILSAVLAGEGSVKALDYALAHVSADWFEDRVQRNLFTILHRYLDQTHGIPGRDELEDLLRDFPPGVAAEYGETYAALAAEMPKPDKFLHAVDMLRILAADRLTGEALAQGMEILRNGVRSENGSRELRGHEDARLYVQAALAEVERDCGLVSTPEGNVLVEAADVLSSYARTKELRLKGEAPGVMFGLPALDDKLGGGLLPGELALLVAWTTAGKSSWCVQMAWHASVVQGKNVVIFTTETLRPQLRIKLVARHSRLPKFGLERGLNSRDIREGRLTDAEERAFAAVLADWKDCRDYGRCYVVQVPDQGTVAGMAARMAAIERQFPIDLCVVDYLQLFSPDERQREARGFDIQSSIIKSAKRLAATHNRGSGVPMVSPWQINREGRQQLQESGKYSLENMSGTQEAAKTPDVVLSLADREEDTSNGRAAPLDLAVLKNRDGPKGQTIRMAADFATNTFTARGEAASFEMLDL